MPAPITACEALAQADAAYLALMTNGAVRSVRDQNGETVEYSTSNAASLLDYIRTLQPLCPTYKAIALGVPSRTRPLRFVF